MTIIASENSKGVILPVRAQPGARRQGVVGEQAGALKIAVTASPERGRANDAIVEVLATSLGIAKSSITLVKGATSRQKQFLLEGVSLDQLNTWLHLQLKSPAT